MGNHQQPAQKPEKQEEIKQPSPDKKTEEVQAPNPQPSQQPSEAK